MSKEIISGIYCIENNINSKKYIGQSNNIYSRWYNHKYCLNNNMHSNSYLQNAWNKYGEENFTFKILELCDSLVIDSREIYYIDKFSTLSRENGYNLTSGGNRNKQLSEDTKEKIRIAHIGKLVSDETRRKISINRTGIMTGKNHPNYGKKIPKEHIELLRSLAKQRNGDKCYQAKKVICINTQEVFSTIKEAGEKYKDYGSNENNIGKCCRKERRYSGKFGDGTPIQWSYYQDNIEYKLQDNIEEHKGYHKPVSQYDKEMNYIATYQSAREASRKTGIGYKLISQVCNGYRKTTHNFIFKFD